MSKLPEYYPTILLVLILSVALVVGIACSASIDDGETQPEVSTDLMLTQSVLETQQAAFSVQQTQMVSEQAVDDSDGTEDPTSPDISQGDHHRIPGLESNSVLVWWLSSGDLVLEHPDRTLAGVDINVPVDSPLGLPGSAQQVLLGDGEVIAVDVRTNTIGVAQVNGQIATYGGPKEGDQLVGASLSPDGNRMIWMYDVTVVPPEPMGRGCDPSWGCEGRIYEILMSDAPSGNAVSLYRFTEAGTNYPTVELAGWRGDGSAVFIKRNSHIPGVTYPDEGGGIMEITVPQGVSNIRDNEYLASNTFISPSGNRMAWNNNVDKGLLLEVRTQGGDTIEIKSEQGVKKLAYQLTFSPDDRWLVWLELEFGESWDQITTATVRGIDLFGSAVPQDMVRYETRIWVDDLPVTTNWLTDTMLLISSHHDTRILDVSGPGWVQFEWPPLTETGILVGAIH